MDILELLPFIYDKLLVFMLVLTRISALFAVFILFRRDYVNPRITITLSMITAFYVVLLNPELKIVGDFFSARTIILMLYQFFLGFIAGFVLNIMLEIFTAFGQIASMQIGLGMASYFDPKFGTITPLTRFYAFSSLMIFLFLNGHIFIIKMMLDSFTVIPIDKMASPHNMFLEILQYSSSIFSNSIFLSIALVVSIFLTNFALAVMSKFSPQFNIFSVGINMTIILGLICLYVTFSIFVDKGGLILQDGMTFVETVLMKMR